MQEHSSQSPRECGCKGIRTCLSCEKLVMNPPLAMAAENQSASRIFSYCLQCQVARCDPSNDSPHPHRNSDLETLAFPGVAVFENFVTEAEEHDLRDVIYRTPFVKSQSGRQKQDYGPKVNFKKQKLKSDTFTGLPDFSEFLYNRMKAIPCLQDFIPVELCNLEYTPERGSAIDPHFDDSWLWGDRLVTLNLLSSTILCFTKDNLPEVEVYVPLLQRSLVVVFGPARDEWKHAIHRSDIKQTRIAMTFRELSPEFRKDGKLENIGQQLVDVALTFSGSAVGCPPTDTHQHVQYQP